ncbi:MAG: hypothetical protein KGZ25_01215 [Planctomycetes bacterium]|nr:hypothetical protein [Planctomycetota bacterium]
MFSKEDYKDYLEQVMALEAKMNEHYKKLARQVDDKEMTALFEQLEHEEANHYAQLEKLEELPSGAG